MTVDNRPKVKTKKEVRDLKAEALKIANMIHIEGQTKAETKLIANGVQRGMEMFLRQQSERARELDKRAKKIKQMGQAVNQAALGSDVAENQSGSGLSKLPWVLLVISWSVFLVVVYFLLR
jgi:hypothetical protein